jgi:hypothetical protein
VKVLQSDARSRHRRCPRLVMASSRGRRARGRSGTRPRGQVKDEARGTGQIGQGQGDRSNPEPRWTGQIPSQGDRSNPVPSPGRGGGTGQIGGEGTPIERSSRHRRCPRLVHGQQPRTTTSTRTIRDKAKGTGQIPSLGGQVKYSRAAYDNSVANYRQTILTAFQGVEDQLSTLRILSQQAVVENAAVEAAQHAVEISLNEYKAGTVAYTTVVTAQARPAD